MRHATRHFTLPVLGCSGLLILGTSLTAGVLWATIKLCA